MAAENIAEANAAAGFDTDADVYYYEEEPRGGAMHIRANRNGVNPRNLTDREKQYSRALYNLRGRAEWVSPLQSLRKHLPVR